MTLCSLQSHLLTFTSFFIYSLQLYRNHAIAAVALASQRFSMAELPRTMKAIKIVGIGKAEVQDVPLPRMRDDYILVKVHAVALNPTDW